MKIVFLGTGAMVPTKDRNVQSIYLEYNGEGILVDCGEGTQRQMSVMGLNRQKVKKVLISHWHGDHVSGLIGLIQTLGNIDEPGTLKVFGPEGSKHYFDHLMGSCAFDPRLQVELIEVKPEDDKTKLCFENDKYLIEAVSLKHSIPCNGYSFIEKDQRVINMKKAAELGLNEGPIMGKLQRGETIIHNNKTIKPEDVSKIKEGKKISFVLDTEACSAVHNLVKDADLLISEATYTSDLDEKAEEYKHMTAQTIAQIASQEGVKKLILTHFSQRYKSVEAIEEDARKVFPDTVCAFDFMQVKL